MTLTINTWDADEDSYDVNVFAANDGSVAANFIVDVGNCNDANFDLEWNARNLCRGNVETIRATIVNDSDFDRVVKLFAENESMLPYFSKEQVSVSANSRKSVDLIVNAAFAPLGKSTVFLRAISGDSQIEKKWDFEVVDCSDVSRKSFFVSAPTNCFNVNKGSEINSTFSVRRSTENCLEDRKLIFFSLEGMPSVISANSAWFDCGVSKTINFKVSVPSDANAGKQNIVIKAYDGEFSDQKNVCINVQGAKDGELILLDGSKDIVRGFSDRFNLKVINTGDSNEIFQLEVSEVPSLTVAALSDTNFYLVKGSSKIVSVLISPKSSIFLGTHYVAVRMIKPVVKTVTIAFNVVETAPQVQSLEVLSYTKEISLQGLDSGRYSMVLRNNSALTLYNITVSVANAPNDININGATVSELPPGNQIEVSGAIYVGDINGSFPVNAIVKSGNITITKDILLLVSPAVQSAQTQNQGVNPFAGLFALDFSKVDPFLLALIFIVWLLLLVLTNIVFLVCFFAGLLLLLLLGNPVILAALVVGWLLSQIIGSPLLLVSILIVPLLLLAIGNPLVALLLSIVLIVLIGIALFLKTQVYNSENEGSSVASSSDLNGAEVSGTSETVQVSE
jgi:uncharacterized membrane protein